MAVGVCCSQGGDRYLAHGTLKMAEDSQLLKGKSKEKRPLGMGYPGLTRHDLWEAASRKEVVSRTEAHVSQGSCLLQQSSHPRPQLFQRWGALEIGRWQPSPR